MVKICVVISFCGWLGGFDLGKVKKLVGKVVEGFGKVVDGGVVGGEG